MARTALTVQPLGNAYAGAASDLTYAATDAVNNNLFTATGRETLTVVSTDDNFGRTEDIAKEVAAGETAMFPMLPTHGYIQADGKIYLNTTSADLVVAVIKVNDN